MKPRRRRDDILEQVKNEDAKAVQQSLRGLILQPGAIGDCILTLPLAQFMKDYLGLGGVDILGHTDYVGFFPQRTCVHSVRSIESVDLHRLYVDPRTFEPADRDSLIAAFDPYVWIASFLGGLDSAFEKNLLYTVHCSHTAEVISIALKPPADWDRHVSEYYRSQFAQQTGLPVGDMDLLGSLIRTVPEDRARGHDILGHMGTALDRPIVVIHPGSGSPAKCWHWENYLAAAEVLRSRGREAVFLLGPAEQERRDRTFRRRLTEQGPVLTDLSLEQVLAVLSCSEAFIGNDSGLSHLAGAMGIRTFVMFGPTDPVLYRPVGPAVTVLRDSSEVFALRPSPEMQERLLASWPAKESFI